MSAMQRRKGQSGERELFALLSDELGFTVRRNVDQARQGGADGLDIPGWAVEAKRQETLSIPAWWAQAERQAEGRRPVLFYRVSRKPWRAVLDLHDVAPTVFPVRGNLCETSLEAACTVIRETLNEKEVAK